MMWTQRTVSSLRKMLMYQIFLQSGMQQKTCLTFMRPSSQMNTQCHTCITYMYDSSRRVLQSHKNFVYCRLWFSFLTSELLSDRQLHFSLLFFLKEGILIENQQFIFKVRMFESTIDRACVSLCNLQACGLILGWIFISWKVNLLLWAICKWIKRNSRLKTDISKGGWETC